MLKPRYHMGGGWCRVTNVFFVISCQISQFPNFIKINIFSYDLTPDKPNFISISNI
jgi:hypothetical protein